MRYRVAVLMLLIPLVMLPKLNVLAAPAPAPSVILQIAPPPKDWSMEKHLEMEIGGHLTDPCGMPFHVWLDPEIRKLPSVAAKKDVKEARSWIAENIQVTKEDGGRRLRLTFRAGTRQEQVAILNALLRAYVQAAKKKQQFLEECLRREENCVLKLQKRMASEKDPRMVEEYRQGIEELRSIQIPARRAEIERFKQITVIKWAR